jgi:hypothetical protein
MLSTLQKQIAAEKNLSKALSEFIGQWVVISQHKVVASGVTPEEALGKAPKKYDRMFRVSKGPFIAVSA